MGSGTLTLTQANTYTGVTLLSAGITSLDPGVIVVAHNQALGTADGGTLVGSLGIVRLANGITVTGETLTINGYGTGNNGNLQSAAGTSGSPASATWAGDVIISTSGARVGTGSHSTLTISGAIRNGSTPSDLASPPAPRAGWWCSPGPAPTPAPPASCAAPSASVGRMHCLPARSLMSIRRTSPRTWPRSIWLGSTRPWAPLK